MKIRSIAVNEFMKFDRPVQVKGLDDHLNIIIGPNEMGKSTLLAALKAAFFETHQSKKKEIVRLQNTRNKTAPVVKVGVEVDGKSYEIEKRFLKKPHAELRYPDGSRALGVEAEFELKKLIGLDSQTRGSIGQWNIFWVEQGKSHSAIDMTEDSLTQLHSALESEVGTILGGRRGRELPQIFKSQRNRYLTEGQQRERGELKDFSNRVDDLSQQLSELRAKRQELSDLLDGLNKNQEKLQRLKSENVIDKNQKELDQSRQRQKTLLQREQEIKTAKAELNKTLSELDNLYMQAKNYRQLEDELTNISKGITNTFQELEAKYKELEDKKNDFKAIHQEVNRKIQLLDNAKRNLEYAQKVSFLASLQEENKRIEATLEKSRISEKQFQTHSQAANAIAITNESLDRIRKLKANLDSATADVKRNAVRIQFELHEGAKKGVTVDDEPLSSEQKTIETVAQIEISIADRGLITIAPALGEHAELQQLAEDAQRKYETELSQVQASSLDEAEMMFADKQAHMNNANQKRHEVDFMIEAVKAQSISQLEHKVREQEQELTSQLTALQLAKTPSIAVAESDIQAKQLLVRDCELNVKAPQADLAEVEKSISELKVEVATLEERLEQSKKRKVEIDSKLKSAHLQSSEQDLQSQIKRQTEIKEINATWLEQLQSEFNEKELDMVETRIARLESSINNMKEDKINLEKDIRDQGGQLKSLFGLGLDEEIQELEREIEIAESEQARLRHEVKILNLLIVTLTKAEQEAKDRFLAPILQQVLPYLQSLFPNATLNLDEDLNIKEIEREYQEPFENLSMGTQEQIAILIRLAFAELLAKQGRPATVVLDDALVYSDDNRIKGMFDILFRVSQDVQVLILTCRESLFENLGGKRLRLEPADPNALRSL